MSSCSFSTFLSLLQKTKELDYKDLNRSFPGLLSSPRRNFTPLEKASGKIGGSYSGENGGFHPEADPPLAEMPPSINTVRERGSLTGFTEDIDNQSIVENSRNKVEKTSLFFVI